MKRKRATLWKVHGISASLASSDINLMGDLHWVGV
jgi:hypothetical protein